MTTEYIYDEFDMLLNKLIERRILYCELLPRGITPFHLEKHEDVYELSSFVKIVQNTTGDKVADIYEIISRNKRN